MSADLKTLKQKRAVIRRNVTKTMTQLDELLGAEPVDVVTAKAHHDVLVDWNDKLRALDEEILGKMTDDRARVDETQESDEDIARMDEGIDQEFESAQQYQLKVKTLVLRVDAKLVAKAPSEVSVSVSTRGVSVDGDSSQYILPKIKLRPFSGRISDWLSWWSHFSTIHDNPKISVINKFEYLLQCMIPGTRAASLVERFPMRESNYPLVVKALQDRYGDEDLLIPQYIRELLKIVIQNASKTEKVPLSTLYDKIETDIRALGTLNVTTQEMGRFLQPIVESCLDEDVYKDWQRSPLYDKDGARENPSRSKLDFLLEFLSEESKREMKREARDFCLEPAQKETSSRKSKKRRLESDDLPAVAGFVAQSTSGKDKCIFCEGNNHKSDKCFKAKNMSLSKKKSKCRENKRCFVCLRAGHAAASCGSNPACSICKQKHVDVMCNLRQNPPPSKEDEELLSRLEKLGTETVQSSLGVNYSSEVLLKTTRIKLRNPATGVEVVVRVLFDDGSQKSYITGRAVRAIASKPVSQEESRIILMDGSMTDFEMTNHHEVMISSLKGVTELKMDVREKPNIGGPTARVPVGPWIQALRKLNVEFYDLETTPASSTVDMLIGQDYYEQCRTGSRVKITESLYAVETIFGWTLCGALPSRSRNVYNSNCGAEISKLWELDVIGIRDSVEHETKLEHDRRVMAEFQSKIARNEIGRYRIQLPWKISNPDVPCNYAVAEKRLISTTKKMNAEDFRKYDSVFKSWLNEGIIEVVPEGEEKQGMFHPHRPVIKLESSTTPIRPVFDASCRVGRQPSINMLLETGMNMLETIPYHWLKFRRYQVAGIADIRKAFQTIEVVPEDRKYQMFLWWKNGEQKSIAVFRHPRVVFGMTCSPFILAAVLDFHLKNKGKTAELLRNSLYVDNLVLSFPRVEDYLKFKEESTRLLADCQMVLRQWESNSDEKHEQETTNVLGFQWNKSEDTVRVKLPDGLVYNEEMEVTSRIVLSLVSQIFDPMGMLCPTTIKPRLLLQDAARKELKWDEPWTGSDREAFLQWLKEVPLLEKVEVERFAFQPIEKDLKIHIFCDASQAAYATVAFVRTVGDVGVNVKFLLAKGRLAPLIKKKGKKITIPRLELLACVIGSRVAKLIMEAYGLDRSSIILWSDSSTCIAWIRREEIWGVFVQNRVNEILQHTNRNQWRFIPGCANSADVPSRPCDPEKFVESNWLEGPSWMRLSESEWPSTSVTYDEDNVYAEKRKTIVSMTALSVNQPRFSSYMKNVRVYGWMNRFVDNLRAKVEDRNLESHLSIEEVKYAEQKLIYQIQQQHFLEKPEVKGFRVEKLEDGLWHLTTRLTYKQDSEGFKRPVILPKNDPLVNQLIEYIHRTSYHGGTQYVLSKIRERYWIIQGRVTVKNVLRKCLPCQRYRVKNMESYPAPLPASRLETKAAFQTTGVDLAGPVFVKGGSKAWIVLYTCGVYRAVHLDLIDTLSTEGFLLSLERFVNTVGRPECIYSDNGTNMVGAVNLMKKIDFTKLKEAGEAKRIGWTFIPPSAPWWGGFWERMVRSIKDLLRKMLGHSKLTFEELRTCLAGVQQTINDRPLTSVNADLDDLQPLTPSMFTRDLPLAFPEGVALGEQFYENSYRKMQELKAALQARFRKEYIGFLTSRNLGAGGKTPKVGTLVLVGDTNKKRFQWPLGKILEVIPGRDGKVRVLKIKTSKGVLTRPVQRVFPLETYEADVTREKVILKHTCQAKTSAGDGQRLNEGGVKCTRSGRESKLPVRYGKWAHQ